MQLERTYVTVTKQLGAYRKVGSRVFIRQKGGTKLDPFIILIIGVVLGLFTGVTVTYHDLWEHGHNESRGWVTFTSKRHFKVSQCDCGDCLVSY